VTRPGRTWNDSCWTASLVPYRLVNWFAWIMCRSLPRIGASTWCRPSVAPAVGWTRYERAAVVGVTPQRQPRM
jgi:hypothetical protein